VKNYNTLADMQKLTSNNIVLSFTVTRIKYVMLVFMSHLTNFHPPKTHPLATYYSA